MKQRASHLLLNRPLAFGFNSETAASNPFQHPSLQPAAGKALAEFDDTVERLRVRGISCILTEDLPGKTLPDSIFPNNWFSTHADGTIVSYPMMAVSRRAERRDDLPEILCGLHPHVIHRNLDLTHFEQQGYYLEGTGSLVFDHLTRKVFMAVSPRSSVRVLEALCKELPHDPIVFNTLTPDGIPVYHTNVVLSIGTKFAVICEEVIVPTDRQQVLSALESTGRTIIGITPEMMAAFGANILEVDGNGEPVILISETALKVLGRQRVRQLEQFGDLLPAAIPTIERVGGGGVRCMAAEIFLPEAASTFSVKLVTWDIEMDKCLQLRWEVLRAPWNQPKGSESDELDGKVPLVGAFDASGRAIGTGRVQMTGPETAQIRYMAVDPKWQGKGVGQAIMRALENQAAVSGAREIMLQARENALRFYLANGYQIAEKTFLLYGEIQHFMMKKRIK